VKLSTYALGLPAVVIAVVIAVANRQSVVFSLDPFSQTTPAIALRMPLFVLLFLTLGAGVVLGGIASFLSRRGRSSVPPAATPKTSPLPGRSAGTKTPTR